MSLPLRTWAAAACVLLAAGCSVQARTPEKSEAAKRVESAAREAFSKLPGQCAFVFTELSESGPKRLFGINDNERFAVGSSFKLYILGALAEEVNADQRRLENVMLLEKKLEGPPFSEMAHWPTGSPVTLHTLALKMISLSDNTATDHLLHLLGRETVERQMRRMGHGKPEVNEPLLSTREMTGLRDKKTGLLAREYQKLDEGAKRKFLSDKFSGEPDYEALEFDTSAYDLAEWYASPMEMARALAWLQANSQADQPAHPVRGILAMETKLPHDQTIWPYVGFKGGSEDQLLAGNWLLQNHNGRWYTFHVFVNSPKEKLDQQAVVEAVEAIFQAVQQEVEAGPSKAPPGTATAAKQKTPGISAGGGEHRS